MYGTKMIARRILSICLLLLLAISARGQVLSDGISGRDLKHNMQFIQAISPQGDTCLVMTDSLGRFEIDPELMEGMRGNVYLKPMVAKPRPKLVIDSPFDSINVMRRGQTRYLSQNHIFEADTEEPVIYYDPGTTLLKESVVKAKRHAVARDKVTGYLDSLTIMSTGAWVCDCVKNPNLPKTLNNYKGWHAHRADYPPPLSTYTGKRLQPKRGEVYGVVRYEPWGPNGEWIIAAMDEETQMKLAGILPRILEKRSSDFVAAMAKVDKDTPSIDVLKDLTVNIGHICACLSTFDGETGRKAPPKRFSGGAF